MAASELWIGIDADAIRYDCLVDDCDVSSVFISSIMPEEPRPFSTPRMKVQS